MADELTGQTNRQHCPICGRFKSPITWTDPRNGITRLVKYQCKLVWVGSEGESEHD